MVYSEEQLFEEFSTQIVQKKVSDIEYYRRIVIDKDVTHYHNVMQSELFRSAKTAKMKTLIMSGKHSLLANKDAHLPRAAEFLEKSIEEDIMRRAEGAFTVGVEMYWDEYRKLREEGRTPEESRDILRESKL